MPDSDPRNHSLPPKTLALRDLAQQGNLAAMSQLLNQALAHKQVETTLSKDNSELEINLTAEREPEQAVCLILLAREIKHWHLDAATTLRISGQVVDAPIPCWQRVISLPSLLESTLQVKPPAKRSSAHLPTTAPLPKIPIRTLDRDSWQAVGAGLLLSLLLISSGQLSFFLSYLIIMVHELGHTFTAWLFGYPAVPAFDFMFGGGVTLHGDRYFILVWLVYLGLGGALYFYRYNRLTQKFLLALAAVYSFFAFTPIHNLLFVVMGHGFELIFASIFLYRALSGFACRYSIERPLYGMVGFFMVFYDLRFTHSLLIDPEVRAIYEQGKGGVIDNDFVRLARDYLQVDLGVVASLFWVLAALIPLMTFLIYRYRAIMIYLFSRLFLVTVD